MLSRAQTVGVVMAASLALHVWLAVGVAAIKPPAPRRAPTSIAIRAAKPKVKVEEPKPELPKPEAPKLEAPKLEAPKTKPAPTPRANPNPNPNPVAAAAPVEIGGNFGNGTLAVPAPAAAPKLADTPVAAKPIAPKIEECSDPPGKPKPIKVLQPAYTEDARSASIEGRVRVEITVDESGTVTSARVLAGLGHGLDEAALAAAKGSTFAAATHCGKPVRATFTIGMRFSL